MTQTLTTERMSEIAKLAIRLQQVSSCAAVTSSGETVLHHTHVDEILSALHDVTAELLANREAQPVYQCRFFTTDIDGKQIGEWQDMDKGFYDQYDPHCRRVLFTAPPAPAVPDFGALTKLIVGRLIDCGAAGDDSIADAETFVYNACRAAMLAQPVSQGYKLPDGFKLMPIEMTDEIGEAIALEARCCGGIALCIYEAALAAAPEGGNG